MSNGGAARQSEAWPVAPVAGLLDTCTTLQLWAQIVGKVRLARAPMVNHWWQATLYLTARGLTTPRAASPPPSCRMETAAFKSTSISSSTGS